MSALKSHLINVRDLIESPGFEADRIYQVTAILLGGSNQESVVELESMDKTDPQNVDGTRQHAMIPFEMLCAGIDAKVFKHTSINQLGR